MKHGRQLFFISLISLLMTMTGCSQTNGGHKTQSATGVSTRQEKDTVAIINPRELFIQADAEEIMGEPMHLADSSTKPGADAFTYLCSYEADTKDSISRNVYFLFEDFRLTELAQKKYTDIRKANEDLGLEVLNNLGDEAYYHGDGRNFHFIMVRKGDKVFNLKVNKITSKTDLDAFKRTAEKIAEQLRS